MPEQLSAADKIVGLWLQSDELEPSEDLMQKIVKIREEFRRDNPDGSYVDVLKQASTKLAAFMNERQMITELSPEDFND